MGTKIADFGGKNQTIFQKYLHLIVNQNGFANVGILTLLGEKQFLNWDERFSDQN